MGSIKRELEAIRAALAAPGEQQTVSLRSAARQLGVSERTLRSMLRAGLARSTVVLGERSITHAEIEQLRLLIR